MWQLFPIRPGTKEPALSGDWRSHATADPAQIEAWRDAGYDLGVDCGASGLLVVDVDGAEGLSTAAEMDLPPTYTVRTPRGGKHLYYAGDGPTSVQKLGVKVDTRGQGGYVVWEAPGYEPIDERTVAALPAWITPALQMRKDRKAALVDGADLPANVRRARAYLIVRKPAIEGSGGNDWTYQTAQALRDLGISEATALSLMLEEWNELCQPPWEPDELEVVIRNAWSYGQNEGGAQAFDFDPQTRFAAVAHEGAPAEEDDPYRPWKPSELLLRPPPQFYFPGIIPKESVGALIAPSDSGKSFFALHCGLTLATGIEGMGQPAGPPRDVLYIPMEGSRDISHNRLPAWREKNGVSQELLDHFRIVENFPDVLDGERVAKLLQRQRDEGLRPDMLLVDTYGRAMGEADLDENKAAEVRRFVRQMEQIKRLMGCTVMLIHHTSKDKSNTSAGSYALQADCDFWMSIETQWEVRAMAVSCGKMKGAARFEPLYFDVQSTANSLTLSGILPNEYKALTQVDDAFSPRAVQAALAKAKAYGVEHAITAHVLASHLYVAQVGEPELEVQAKLDRIARKLTALGKGRFEHLVTSKGWMLPDQ
jgi:KaiC/GvpD/RAD55 family RecA-like ATPase